MTFENEKKTFLGKFDQSKKGSIDEKCLSIIEVINKQDDYYTTPSCSGRVYLWRGDGKKNNTEWLKVSHDLVDYDFLNVGEEGLIWLRVEPFILHVACKDLTAANKFLSLAQKVYKKSTLLSISNKIIVEIRGSEFMEMPLYLDGKVLFNGDINWLTELVNSKLDKIFSRIKTFEELF